MQGCVLVEDGLSPPAGSRGGWRILPLGMCLENVQPGMGISPSPVTRPWGPEDMGLSLSVLWTPLQLLPPIPPNPGHRHSFLPGLPASRS